MTDLIRSAALTHYAEVAQSVGLNPAEMLRKVGLPQTTLKGADLGIAVSGARQLLEVSAAAAGIDDFGLRLAERSGLPILGPVALVVREQPTVGAAMDALARYVHISSETLRLRIERQGPVVRVVRTLTGRPGPAPQSAQFAIGIGCRILSAFLGDMWRPLEIQFSHPAPRDRASYRRFFGCTVTFDADADVILCPAADFERPIATADAAIARYAENFLKTIAARPAAMDDKVRELIAALLPTGLCSIERIAEHLLCDRRTIHRRLALCGTTFSELVDTERTDLVVRLLGDRNRPLPEVAELLGFSAQSAMARWFRGKFGCSMRQWRAGVRPVLPAEVKQMLDAGRARAGDLQG
jgi:AraC-like DNA-binding protein